MLAEILTVTNAVELAPDVPAAATQAHGLSSLPSLGLVPLSVVTIMLLSFPMLIVVTALSRRLGILSLSLRNSPLPSCGDLWPQGGAAGQQKTHTFISTESLSKAKLLCSNRASTTFLSLQRCQGALAAQPGQAGYDTKEFRFKKTSFPRAGDSLAFFH